MKKTQKYPDEGELTRFHAQIEKQEGLRDVSRRNAQTGQRSSKPEAMQQAESKSYDPRLAIGQAIFASLMLGQFSSEEDNAQCDNGFHWGGSDMHHAENG